MWDYSHKTFKLVKFIYKGMEYEATVDKYGFSGYVKREDKGDLEPRTSPVFKLLTWHGYELYNMLPIDGVTFKGE